MKINPKRFWHYTAKSRIDEIINSEVIRLTSEGIDKKEKPAVWISTNTVWEHTVTKLYRSPNGSIRSLTFDEMATHFGLARIEIKPDITLVSWAKFKHVSGISIAMYDSLEQVGIDKGSNPKEWYASFKSIGIDRWIRAEIWENGQWKLYKDFK